MILYIWSKYLLLSHRVNKSLKVLFGLFHFNYCTKLYLNQLHQTVR